MTNKTQSIGYQRKKYSTQFKEQALEHAKRDGVVKAAQDLGLHSAMIYAWKKKATQTGVPFEDQKLQDAEISRLKREVSRLSEECAFLKKAAAYFAKEPR